MANYSVGRDSVQYFVNYRRSKGNFFVDANKNVMLDLVCQGGSLPLGYNNDYMLDAVSSSAFDQFLLQKPIIQAYPPQDFYSLVRKILTPISPQGLKDIVLTGTGNSTAVEMAIRGAILRYIALHKLESSHFPEKAVSIMSFDGSSHGTSLATLSLSKERSQNFPCLNVISAPFPKARTPLTEYQEENTKNEAKCLEQCSQLICDQLKTKPVAAIIIEPIQHKETRMASREFFRKLRQLAKEKGIPFIVDEVHTGGGSTGKLWAHEHWMIEDPADIVVFGKKLQVSGYYCKPEFRPENPKEITDCWNDVGWRLIQLQVIISKNI